MNAEERVLWEVVPESIWANPRWEFGIVLDVSRWGFGLRLLNSTWNLIGGPDDGGHASYRELALFAGPVAFRLSRSEHH